MDVDGYLLDTMIASWAFDALKPQHEPVRNWLASKSSALVFVSPITLAEIEFGLQIAVAMDPTRRQAVRQAMSEFTVLSIDANTREYYSPLRAELFDRHVPRNRQGRFRRMDVEDMLDSSTQQQLMIQENDLWIVAVAIQYDLRLVTADKAVGMRRILEAAAARCSCSDRAMIWPDDFN